MTDDQYLGCAQKPCEPAEEDIGSMGVAFENFSVKRGDPSARAARPDQTKTSPEAKADDEKESASIGEGKTSRGNAKITKNVTQRISVDKMAHKHKVRGYAYDMQDHTEGSVAMYLELSGKHGSTFHPVATHTVPW